MIWGFQLTQSNHFRSTLPETHIAAENSNAWKMKFRGTKCPFFSRHFGKFQGVHHIRTLAQQIRLSKALQNQRFVKYKTSALFSTVKFCRLRFWSFRSFDACTFDPQKRGLENLVRKFISQKFRSSIFDVFCLLLKMSFCFHYRKWPYLPILESISLCAK